MQQSSFLANLYTHGVLPNDNLYVNKKSHNRQKCTKYTQVERKKFEKNLRRFLLKV